MGIFYYIVCDKTMEIFELGGGPWGGHPGRGGKPELNYDEVGLDFKTPGRQFQALFASHVMQCWDSGNIERPYNKMEIFQLGCEIWKWCEDRKWQVRVVSDYDNDSQEWMILHKVTGSRFKE